MWVRARTPLSRPMMIACSYRSPFSPLNYLIIYICFFEVLFILLDDRSSYEMNLRTRSRVVSFSSSSLKENFSSLSRIYIRYFFYFLCFFFLLSRRSRTRSRAASLLRKGRPVDPRSADRWWTTPTCVANMYSSARGGKRACARSRGSAPADSARRFKELITLILEFFFSYTLLRKNYCADNMLGR